MVNKMPQVLSEKNGPILRVILNRPEKNNVFNAEMISQLLSIFKISAKDPALRVVHLSGNGKNFCAGADLEWMLNASSLTTADNMKDADQLLQLYETIFDCPHPVVTSVQGYVLGGGIGLSSVSDIVIAEKNSWFALSETRRGLVPVIMLPWVLDKLGKSRARELLITGRIFNTNEAIAYGLVHFEASIDIEKLFQQIIQNGPEAIYHSRTMIAAFTGYDRKKLACKLAEIRTGKEATEGIRAFFEKRPPAWVNPDIL
jgi:methylglutaconyl-CoA hydratase